MPAISTLNGHHEDLQPHLSPTGASETQKHNSGLNEKWKSVQDQVREDATLQKIRKNKTKTQKKEATCIRDEKRQLSSIREKTSHWLLPS